MFASLNREGDDDDGLDMFRRVEVNPISFPVDCIGIIISYSSSPLVVMAFLRSCRMVKKFIEIDRPDCCSNVCFKMVRSTKKAKTFVFSLIIEHVKVTNKLLNKFPNLISLSLRNVKTNKSVFNISLPLQSLEIVNCSSLSNPNLLKFSGSLKKLKIMGEMVGSKFSLESSEFLLPLEELELLELSRISFSSDLDPKHFCKIKSLRILRLIDTGNFSNDIFLHLKDLEVLDVERLYLFYLEHLDTLEKLRKLRIVRCRGEQYDEYSVSQKINLYTRKTRVDMEIVEHFVSSHLSGEEAAYYGFY